jgi:beta-glucanase (GH16 family)
MKTSVKSLSMNSSLAIASVALAALTGGICLVRADWQVTWSDEFDGSTVDTTKWVFEFGNNNGWGNGEREYYTNRTTDAYVAGGALHIVAKRESVGGFPYTSARMKTQGLFSKKYGKFEFRAKLPRGLGYWPALWMMGTNITSVSWPACGEIDVMEFNGSWSNRVQGTIHYSDSGNNHQQQTAYRLLPTPPGDPVTNFHTYAVEWTTNSIKWLVDGSVVQTWTNWSSSTGPYPAPFNQPFFILMNLAIGGSYLSNPTDAQINAGTVFPGEMQVDYVRAYDYVASLPSVPTGLTVSPGDTEVFLSWDASTSGATGYNVKRATSSGGPYTTVASPTANSHTDTGLSGCTTYYYVVSATNSMGETTNSTEKTAELGAFALAVNSGGSAVGQFNADAYVSGGTQASPVTTAIDTTGLAAPAPQAVYQTERYGNFTYTFTGLTTGLNYKVRLHFAETYWTGVGQRQFNVSINGTQVLPSFDIIAVAGAQYKATIQEFTATATSGQIVVQYTTVTDNAKASGIEILLPRPAAPAGLTANPGDGQVGLSWSSVAGASYNLKRALVAGGPYNSVSNGLSTTSFTDTGLTNGTTYYYVISATIAGCESTNSAYVSATPVCSPPAAPIAGNNGPIFAGMTLNLTASTVPGATYNWTGPNSFSSTNQNPSIVNATTSASGLYSVTAANGPCTSAPGTTTVTVNPPASLSIQFSDGNVILAWPGGTLQSATDVSGPWDDVSGATSPRTNSPAASQEFYRLRLP